MKRRKDNFLDNLSTCAYLHDMKNLQVGEFKSRFSRVLEDVRKGEEITISYGKKKEKVAVIVPYSKYKKNIRRKLGILEKRATCVIGENFSLSDEDMIES